MPAALPLVAGALAGFGAGAMFGVGIVGARLLVLLLVVLLVVFRLLLKVVIFLKGVLYGAVGGAVGGAIGGAISAYTFGVRWQQQQLLQELVAAVSGSSVTLDGVAGVKAYAGIGAEGAAAKEVVVKVE